MSAATSSKCRERTSRHQGCHSAVVGGSRAQAGTSQPASKAFGPGTKNAKASANRFIVLNAKQTASASVICLRETNGFGAVARHDTTESHRDRSSIRGKIEKRKPYAPSDYRLGAIFIVVDAAIAGATDTSSG